MKKIILMLFVLAIVVLTGCTTDVSNTQTQDTNTQSNSPTQTQTKNTYIPASIVEFSSADEGELIRFFFQIQDSNGNRIPANGQVNFKIMDNSDKVLYQKDFSVSSSQYIEYEFKLTGQSVGKVYEWRVPIKDIKKGISNYGKAEIKFKSDGKELTKIDEYVSIPSLSEEEISQISEDEYQQNAIDLNLAINDDGLNIIVKKYGFFTTYSYSGSEDQYRVDIILENKGEETYFRGYGSVLLDDKGNQYESAYGGTLSSEDLKSGVTKSGYLLFEDVPKDVSASKIQIGDDYIFDIKNSKAYTPEQMFEEEYNKNKIVYEKSISKGDFQVDVKSFGFYKTKSYSSTEENFRIDFFVKSKGSESEYFSPSSMSILDSEGNQYEKGYGGTLDTFKSMFPNTKQEGYVIFEDVPKTITSAKLVFELGHDSNWNSHVFEYSLPVTS